MRATPILKIGTGRVELEIIGEPTVVLTIRGYAPILRVRDLRTGLDYELYITAKSLADELERLRNSNGGLFTGIRMGVSKESPEKTSKYRVEPLR